MGVTTFLDVLFSVDMLRTFRFLVQDILTLRLLSTTFCKRINSFDRFLEK